LNRKAFDILSGELGVLKTLRFFGQLGYGAGNYTEERRQLFADLTLDEYRLALPAKAGGSPSRQESGKRRKNQ
jgi:hypothetical protein